MQSMSIDPDRAPAPSGPHVAQLVICYRSSIVDVVQLRSATDRYSVGESPAASFKLSGAPLPNPDATTLVERIGDRYMLTVPPCFAAHFELRGAPLEAATSIELVAGLRATLVYGELRFEISLVDPEAVLAGRRRLDRPFLASVVGIASLAGLAALLLRATPADGMSLALDDDAAAARLASYFETAEPEPLAADEAESEPADASTPTPDKRERSEQSGRSKRDSPARDEASSSASVPGLRGPKHATAGSKRSFNPSLDAQHAGILGVLADQERPFLASAEGAFGSSEADTALWANTRGLADHGIAGLGLTSTGRQGGGTASGLGGLDAPSLLGHGTGSDDARINVGPRYPDRKRRVPVATICKLEVAGATDKGMVRRVVRAHINEVRSCYNAGLAHNPGLEGRVTVQFSIVSGGKVATAIIAENTTQDTKLGACIAQAVKRWRFPIPPGGGTTVVSYPLQLHPR